MLYIRLLKSPKLSEQNPNYNKYVLTYCYRIKNFLFIYLFIYIIYFYSFFIYLFIYFFFFFWGGGGIK